MTLPTKVFSVNSLHNINKNKSAVPVSFYKGEDGKWYVGTYEKIVKEFDVEAILKLIKEEGVSNIGFASAISDGILKKEDWSSFNSKQDNITPSTNTHYYAGDKQFRQVNSDHLVEGISNVFFTESRSRETVLTGLSTSINTSVSATDSFLVAIGKLQAQSNSLYDSISTINSSISSINSSISSINSSLNNKVNITSASLGYIPYWSSLTGLSSTGLYYDSVNSYYGIGINSSIGATLTIKRNTNAGTNIIFRAINSETISSQQMGLRINDFPQMIMEGNNIAPIARFRSRNSSYTGIVIENGVFDSSWSAGWLLYQAASGGNFTISRFSGATPGTFHISSTLPMVGINVTPTSAVLSVSDIGASKQTNLLILSGQNDNGVHQVFNSVSSNKFWRIIVGGLTNDAGFASSGIRSGDFVIYDQSAGGAVGTKFIIKNDVTAGNAKVGIGLSDPKANFHVRGGMVVGRQTSTNDLTGLNGYAEFTNEAGGNRTTLRLGKLTAYDGSSAQNQWSIEILSGLRFKHQTNDGVTNSFYFSAFNNENLLTLSTSGNNSAYGLTIVNGSVEGSLVMQKSFFNSSATLGYNDSSVEIRGRRTGTSGDNINALRVYMYLNGTKKMVLQVGAILVGSDYVETFGAYGATPVVQQSISSAATDALNYITQIEELRTALTNLGWVKKI